MTGLVLLASTHVHALTLDTSLGAGMLYTDNAALTSSNEEDDWIARGAVGVTLTEDTGPLTASAVGSFRHLNYLNNTFGDQDYLNAGVVASWEQVAGSLVWNVRDYYTQLSVDSLGKNTPDNTQNTNVFSFGPDFLFMLSQRSQVSVGLEFRDFYYQDSNTDNQQYSLDANWRYQMYPTLSVGLSGDVRQVSYDDEDLNPDYTSSNLGLVFTGTTPRSSYNINLGARHIDRDRFDNQEGFSGSIDWSYTMTGKSSVRAYMSSDISDSSSDFYNSATDPDTGDFNNVQVSGDVLQNNTFRLTYNRVDSAFNSRLWIELRDLDYEESPNDREVQEYGADLDYQVSSMLTTGLNGAYLRTKETSIGRTDKEYFLGAYMSYSLSRKLSCNVDLQYRERDTTLSNSDYTGTSVFAGLDYTIGGRGSSLGGRGMGAGGSRSIR